ncbi:MAG: Vmc-like lipoprotein signal peptide domain-containing protein [Gemmataceae bacterium]
MFWASASFIFLIASIAASCKPQRAWAWVGR